MISRCFVVLVCSAWLRGAAPTALPIELVAAPPTPSIARDDLLPYLELAATQEIAAAVAQVERAAELARNGDETAAVEAYHSVAERVPGLADWAYVLAADAAAARGDTTAVRSLLAQAEPELARDWGWRALVRGYRAAGDLTSAAILARTVSEDSLGDETRRAEAARFAGEIALIDRDTAAAITQFRHAIRLAPHALAAVNAARRLSDLPPLTAEDRGSIGRLYLRHGNLDRGIAGVDAFVEANGGTAAERAAARLEAGRALYKARRYAEAERRMLALGEVSSQPAIAAEALLLAGRAQYRIGKVDAAKATYAATARRYPGQRGTAEALFMLGDLEHDDGRLSDARAHYQAAIDAHPAGDEAARAAMRLGGIAFTTGDAVGAVRVFEDYRSVHDTGSAYQQATYWAARAYLELGDTALGNDRLRETWALDPASYYGLQSAERLGADWRETLAPSPEADNRTLIEATGAIRRLEILAEAGLEAAADFEMKRVRRYFEARPAALCMLAETMHARDETLAAVRLGRAIARAEGGWSERVLRIVYPLPFKDTIVREAERHGIDPYLAAGLIRQESLFDPRAVSGAGAIGLMQVMPRTGRTLGRSEGLGSVTSRLLRTPDVNIRIGMRYLSDMLEHYSGNIPFVLAAYNAGPSRVARWRKLAEAYDPDLFAERIPYEETRDYVKVVQQNARIYRTLYASSRPARAAH